MKNLTILFAATLMILLACVTDSLHAQSLSLSPAMMDATVKRGATYTNTFTLTNGTNARLRVHCSVNDYWYNDRNQRLTGRAGTLPRSASLWVQFTPSEFIIEPHTSGNVNAIITVPKDATGGYYTAPVFETQPVDSSPQTTGTAQAAITVRLQGLLSLTTQDATEYNVEIMTGQISPPTVASPLEMNLDVRNRSTSHARVHGAFAILDACGKLAGRGKIEEKRYMPGQRASFKTAWVGELVPGRYTALITLSYDRAGMTPATLVYEVPFETGTSVAALTQQ
ncbi:MAG: hypothetical protein QOH71_4270 [Blastocatellia bacterium]|jgi:hypothetical protein|nr:hypothetical protein [Blastocatellia bacterium]